MTSHRAIVVCAGKVASAVEKKLSEQGQVCLLVSQDMETAFAFAGRDIPELGEAELKHSGIAAVSGGDAQFIWLPPDEICLKTLIPKLSLTIGITLPASAAGVIERSAFLRSLMDSIGTVSEEIHDNDCIGYRWDLDGPIGGRWTSVASKKLASIGKQLEKADVEHRIALFEGGWGSVQGDLEVDGEALFGPWASISIDWIGTKGPNSVTANDSDFQTDGDDIADSDVWTS